MIRRGFKYSVDFMIPFDKEELSERIDKIRTPIMTNSSSSSVPEKPKGDK